MNWRNLGFKIGYKARQAWDSTAFKRKAYANKYMYKFGLKSIPKRYSGYKLVKVGDKWYRMDKNGRDPYGQVIFRK